MSDTFCPYCSQLNSTKQLSLKDFFGEFLNSIVSYDSRLRYTVKDLLFKPGTITRNYANGQRLRYANPFRFFLSVSIIYFLLSGVTDTFYTDTSSNNDINFTSDDKGAFQFSLNGDKEDKALVDSLQKVIDSVKTQAQLKSQDSINLDSIRPNNYVQAAEVPDLTKYDTYVSQAELDTIGAAEGTIRKIQLYIDYYDETEVTDAEKALKELKHENTWFNRWLYEKNDAVNRIKDNPQKFAYYLLQKIPFFLFFFTPVFALFFWLIYSKKKHNYMEHMIFIFHIFSFLFLGLLICFLPDILFGEDYLMAFFLSLIGPFYFYKALRNFYKQRRFITIIKFIFLNFVFWISASFAGLLFIVVTAAIY